MSMLSHSNVVEPSWLGLTSSVALGEGRRLPIPQQHAVSGETAEYFALLFAQLYSGIEYLSRHYALNTVPDYFTMAEPPGIPITLKVTSVEESEFYFDDED